MATTPVPLADQSESAVPRVLVLADSLAFHGPVRPELLTDPRIYPNVMAQALGVEADVVAQVGWTARHVWRSLTRDPRVYSFLVPAADAVVVAVGGMDYLPTALPTHLREGIGFLRPAWVRRGVRRAYLAGQPRAARWTRGRLRSLPQPLTDRYLANCVSALRVLRPGLPIIADPAAAAPGRGVRLRTAGPRAGLQRCSGLGHGARRTTG